MAGNKYMGTLQSSAAKYINSILKRFNLRIIKNTNRNVNKLLSAVTQMNQPRLLNELGQPTGQSSKFYDDYLSLNIKVLASYLAEMKCNELLSKPVPQAPYPVHLKSKLATQEDMESGWCRYWLGKLGIPFHYHRKFWEYAYVLQVLYEYGMIGDNKKGLGLACGEELTPCFLASQGCYITAGDKPLAAEDEEQSGWMSTKQYTQSLDSLYVESYMDREQFNKRVQLEYIDMNYLPEKSFEYDFCWSICAIEHLGNSQAVADFLKNSLKLIKSGGISVHTTEFNYLDTKQTLDNCGSVIFKKKQLEKLAADINELGGEIVSFDFNFGNQVFDKYIDRSPHAHQYLKGVDYFFTNINTPHIKVAVQGVPTTCFGLIIKKK